MGAFRNPRDDEGSGMFEVNMTPLIDVSLVLVVILLLATPLAFESSIAVRQTQASGRTAPDDTKIDRVEIDIVNESQLRVNKLTVDNAQLEPELRSLLTRDEHQQVIVTCAADVSHGTFVDVLDRTKMCGATQISVVGD
jgi:biopolymer transport protein ExbD